MSNARDKSRYAGLALVVAMTCGLLFWAAFAFAVVPKSWITWSTSTAGHGTGR